MLIRLSGCFQLLEARVDWGQAKTLGLRLNRFAIPALILFAATLPAVPGQAMEIRQYDKMESQDRNEYIADLLTGTQKVLNDEGRSDLAARVNNLFTEKLGGDDLPLGLVEFGKNLALARVADAERAAQDPNAHRLEIEDAMLVTLQKNNIPLSRDFVRAFRAINSNFRPK
jgi:hypothetical protein